MTIFNFNDIEFSNLDKFYDIFLNDDHSKISRFKSLNHKTISDFIKLNFHHNLTIWKEEDLARRVHSPDSEIVLNKRIIDINNQLRNNCIEKIDELIIKQINSFAENSRMNSETPGSIIDRISIISLKIFFLNKRINDENFDKKLIPTCSNNLITLHKQRSDLLNCLTDLIKNCFEGNLYFKIYYQHKMYNDKKLNPELAKESI